ncbi:MAG: hypothetical protein ACI915_000545 [Gammaproteobacteria bacterium]|jgi:hypothetical protein
MRSYRLWRRLRVVITVLQDDGSLTDAAVAAGSSMPRTLATRSSERSASRRRQYSRPISEFILSVMTI